MGFEIDFYKSQAGQKALANITCAEIRTDLEIGTEEWLELRKTGIGGSEAAAVMGINPWSTPLAVYLKRKGQFQADETPNEKMEWGTRLEHAILEKYAEQHPEYIVAPGVWFRNKKYPWLCGDTDALVFDRQTLHPLIVPEAKNVGSHMKKVWGEAGTDEAPTYYLAQDIWYMRGLEIPEGIILVLIGGQEYREYPVKASPQLMDEMLRRVGLFWTTHVEAEVPPDPTGHEKDSEHLSMLYPVSKPDVDLSMNDEVIKAVRDLCIAKKLLKKAEENLAGYEATVKKLMGEAELIVTPDGRISWKSGKPRRTTSWSKVHKEIADEFSIYTQLSGHTVEGKQVPIEHSQYFESVIEKHTKLSPSRPFKVTPKEEDDQ